MKSNQKQIENLRWKKFPVLNDGFVCLVDCMGDDSSVVQAARVSYGKDKRIAESHKCPQCGVIGHWRSGQEFDNQRRCPEHGAYTPESNELEEAMLKEDRGLIRYLMRHRHTTPFEMAEVKLLVRVPMDCWRQWIRHRTQNVNEYSTRYTEAIDSQQITKPDQWRLQSTNNKQGSSGFLDKETGQVLSNDELRLHEEIRILYQERLSVGVAKEQARKDLPLSTYTEAYVKNDIHNWLHFLGLRMDSHAQQEIREYATIIGEQIIKPLFPAVWEAFEDYRLGAMFLTRLDLEVIRMKEQAAILQGPTDEDNTDMQNILNEVFTNKREKEECVVKLKRMGLVSS